MAFSPLITDYFTSWAVAGTDITVPVASIPELTAAEADAATGDIRKVMFALLEQFSDVWLALEAADKSTQMTVAKTEQITGTGKRVEYKVAFNVAAVEVEVEDEPIA